MRFAILGMALMAAIDAWAEPTLERVTISSVRECRIGAYPTLDRLADGRLLCVYSAITVAVRSDDSGRSWSKPYDIPMGHRYTSGKINRGIVLRDGTAMFGYSWDMSLDTFVGLSARFIVTPLLATRDRTQSPPHWRWSWEARWQRAS